MKLSTTTTLKSIYVLSVITCYLTCVPTAWAEDSANHAIAANLGSLGLGVSYSQKTDWHFSDHDQIQWRIMGSGLSADLEDEDDNIKIAGIDYEDMDIELLAIQAGADWYPFNSGWYEEIFFSGGLMYLDHELEADADTDKAFTVGNTRVNRGDITSLHMETSNTSVQPYVGLGWGNNLVGQAGFDFRAELGLTVSTRDPKVTLTPVDPGNVLTDAELAREEKDIEDDLGGVSAFAGVAVGYHF